ILIMKKFLFGTAVLCLTFFSSTSSAATVSCMFMSETTISKSGEWIKADTDFMKLYNMFGDGLKIPLKNSLLGNLDSGKPFMAGTVKRGNVYLMGGDMGVEGKLISVQGNNITIYDGMCTTSFG
ncbi:uncharacterized protein METZ01_LOCUS510234, partial [marine metagenome]